MDISRFVCDPPRCKRRVSRQCNIETSAARRMGLLRHSSFYHAIRVFPERWFPEQAYGAASGRYKFVEIGQISTIMRKIFKAADVLRAFSK
jgi:hypothetical protein